MKESNVLYKEDIFAKGLIIIMTIVAFIFLSIFLFDTFVESLGNDAPPAWFYIIMLIFFGLIIFNFSELKILITEEKVHISFGFFHYNIPLNQIEKCYVDDAPSLFYGGWGVRIGRRYGKWRLVFSVIGKSRVVIDMKGRFFGGLVFSTNKPNEILKIIEEKINVE